MSTGSRIAAAQTKLGTITVEDGRQLIYHSLRAEGFTSHALRSDSYADPSFPGFYFYDVFYGFNPNGSSTVGIYAVEKTTGEVWDGATCAHYTSPVLQKTQQDLRRRIGLTDQEKRRSEKPGPYCSEKQKANLAPMPKAWK